jgi:hypothetical protein
VLPLFGSRHPSIRAPASTFRKSPRRKADTAGRHRRVTPFGIQRRHAKPAPAVQVSAVWLSAKASLR